MNNPPTLTLYAESLLSKWGFGDGDTPEHLLDYWDEVDVNYTAFDWHPVLRHLVRTHLIPEIEKHHRVTVVDVETIHNPIRIEVVDGREVDYPDDDMTVLTPESVEVSYDQIMEAIREAG